MAKSSPWLWAALAGVTGTIVAPTAAAAAATVSGPWRSMLVGGYLGGMVLLAMYSLFALNAKRGQGHLALLGVLLAAAAWLTVTDPLLRPLFWPGQAWVAERLPSALLALGLILANRLTLRCLGGAAAVRGLRLVLLAVDVVVAVCAGLALWLGPAQILFGLYVLALFSGVMALVASVQVEREGEGAVRFLALAWGLLLALLLLWGLVQARLLPLWLSQPALWPALVLILCVILGQALAEQWQFQSERALQEQRQALHAEHLTRLAQERVLDVNRQATARLEAEVRERTEALERAQRNHQDGNAVDKLTGLKSRQGFDQALQEEYVRCQRYHHPVAVLMIELDDYPALQSRWGVAVEDCLRFVGERVGEAVRWPMDKPAHYRGPLFGVVLPETDGEGALRVAERMRLDVAERPLRIGSASVRLQVSIGVAACVPMAPVGAAELMEHAELALAYVRGQGGNGSRLYRDGQGEASAAGLA